jgi:hypothetical protein
MSKLSPVNALAAATLFAVAAGSAWSDEATPQGTALPAAQTAAPVTGFVPPGWYVPPPGQGGYAQPWQLPSWPAPPPGYGHPPPYYPPYGQFRAVPATPAKNPLSAELRQTREQLTAKSTELDTANAQLATLQADLQAATEALQQALSETAISSQQLGTAMAQAESLRDVLADLAARLDSQQTTLQTAGQTRGGENDSVRSTPADLDEPPTASKAEPQAVPQALQRPRPGTATPAQLRSAAGTQAGVYDNELTELKVQLENQKIILEDKGQALAAVVAERNGLLADMTSAVAEREGLQKDMVVCRRELTRAQAALSTTHSRVNTPR